MAEHKRGRPPLDATDTTVAFSVYVPTKTYDRLCTEARREALSLPEYVRQVLNKNIDKSTND
jgi:predicted HicB family RNase H-like nuclease